MAPLVTAHKTKQSIFSTGHITAHGCPNKLTEQDKSFLLQKLRLKIRAVHVGFLVHKVAGTTLSISYVLVSYHFTIAPYSSITVLEVCNSYHYFSPQSILHLTWHLPFSLVREQQNPETVELKILNRSLSKSNRILSSYKTRALPQQMFYIHQIYCDILLQKCGTFLQTH